MKTRSSRFRARCRLRVGGGLAVLLAVAAAGAFAEGNILQYDAQGRVIDRVQVQPGGAGNGGSGGAGGGATGFGRDAFVPGEILAVSQDPRFAGRVRSLGFSSLERTALPALDMTVYRLRTPAGAPVPQALSAFRSTFPDVLADANTMVFPAGSDRGWDAVATVGWPAQHDACGRGMRIGMIDTPLDFSHEAFRNRQVTNRSFLPETSKAAPPGHGTAVAALLVGDPSSAGFGGLLPEAQLYAANIFEEQSSGQVAGNLHALLGAFDWIVKQDVAVLNLSLETGSNVILDRAVERTLAKGLIVTAAAGNGGAEAGPAFPAAHPQVLSATAIDPDLRAYRHANHGTYIDFAAPGVSLWTAVPGGGELQSGTSFAVPFLTAAAAMQLASGQRSDPARLREALRQSVRDLGAPGKDDIFGWGLLSYRPDCS